MKSTAIILITNNNNTVPFARVIFLGSTYKSMMTVEK